MKISFKQRSVSNWTSERAHMSVACGGDVALRRDVESLLSQHETGGSLQETSVPGERERDFLEIFAGDDKDPLLGRRLGAYRIEREIGRGGMGAVYEAVRVDHEFHKRVAIKLVKRGMDTDFILRRFRKERQILAALDHPHIALLLDGGTTDDGLPVIHFLTGLSSRRRPKPGSLRNSLPTGRSRQTRNLLRRMLHWVLSGSITTAIGTTPSASYGKQFS